MSLKKVFAAGITATMLTSGAVPAGVDPNLPSYQRAAGISGNLTSIRHRKYKSPFR